MSAVVERSAAELAADLKLTATERQLLAALTKADGAIVTKAALQEATGSRVRTVKSNAQEVLISRMRRKLHEGRVPLRIDNVRQQGYRLVRNGGAA